MAFALDALGKEVRIVNADPPPSTTGVPRHGSHRDRAPRSGRRRRRRADRDGVRRPEADRRERPRGPLHHQHRSPPGNRMYGAINWVDESAAACGEMVFDLIDALGVPLTIEIATHIYLAILTDTGSFHHSNITPKTFDICRRTVEAGVNPGGDGAAGLRQNSFGKLKLIGALLADMELLDGGRLAVMYLDDDIMNAPATYNDTEGLINLPLTAREIQAVVFFKLGADGDIHVSMRSKYDVDVRAGRRAPRRRRPQERAGFKVGGPARRGARRHPRTGWSQAIANGAQSHGRTGIDARRLGRRQAGRADIARHRRARRRAHRRRRASATPGRSTRSPPACCRCVVGQATRLAQFLVSRREGIHRRGAARLGHSHLRRRGAGHPRRRRPAGGVAAGPRRHRDPRGDAGRRAARVHRHLLAGTAALLGQKDRRHAGVRPGPAAQGRRDQAGAGDGARAGAAEGPRAAW